MPSRQILGVALALLLTAIHAPAAPVAAVGVTVGAAAGAEIPADFIGLSFEISNLMADRDGRYQFSADNRALIALFRAAGIRNLRIGGGTAEPKSADPQVEARTPVPGEREIDQLFAFAEAADLRIIYTLRLLRGDPDRAARIAAHIARHHSARLDSFSIGNEPDWHAYHSYPGRSLDPAIVETEPGKPGSAYPSYLSQWRKFAAAVLAQVPAARFSGPDTGSNFPVPGAKDTDVDGHSWTERFAADVGAAGHVVAVLPHDYVGQSAEGVSIPAAVDAMLGREWPAKHYPALFDHVLAPVQRLGLPYRMTECNDHTGGVDGASNAFVSALWALDYMHWHARRGAIGVNFHNKRWIHTCTVIQDRDGTFRLNPKAYGLRAFDLGSRGRVVPVTLANESDVNLTAYAVRGTTAHFVTLVNKEHGNGARGASAVIALPARIAQAEVMLLTSPGNDPTARQGMTLGGEAFGADGSWTGKWTSLAVDSKGMCRLDVPPTAAAILRIRTAAP